MLTCTVAGPTLVRVALPPTIFVVSLGYFLPSTRDKIISLLGSGRYKNL